MFCSEEIEVPWKDQSARKNKRVLEPFSTRAKSRRRTADTATGITPGTAAAVPAKTPFFSESKD